MAQTTLLLYFYEDGHISSFSSDDHVLLEVPITEILQEMGHDIEQISYDDTDEDSVYKKITLPTPIARRLLAGRIDTGVTDDYGVFEPPVELEFREEDAPSTFEAFITAKRASDIHAISEKHPDYVNKQNKDGKTALILAAEREDTASMLVLIQMLKADIFVKDKNGKTAGDYFESARNVTPRKRGIIISLLEKAGKPFAQSTAGLDTVSRHKEMGMLDTLPKDTVSRIAELASGLSGTVEQQRNTIRQSVGKSKIGGRTRKTKKKGIRKFRRQI